MIQPKSYLPVHDEIFYAPLLKENLRLEFASAEDKLDDLSLLAALMLRDGKSADDIVQVTMLPLAVVKNVLDELDDLSPEAANKILQLSDCVNAFNLSPPQIFSDILTRSPVLLPAAVKAEKSFDETNCAAVVKNFNQIATADFEDIFKLVKNFVLAQNVADFDELKVLRLAQKSEVFFAARELKYLPVVGENNFVDTVTLDSRRTIAALLPVRKFAADDMKFCVDLLLGTVLLTAVDEDDSEEATLAFKPRPEFTADEFAEQISAHFGNVVDNGTAYVKISIAQETAGDFLCA